MNTDRPAAPRGHLILDRDTFDRLVWPTCDVELPDGAGWATAEDGPLRVCTWLPASVTA